MFQYVALTDGTTTIELTDGISYALVSYAPGIPAISDNDLSGDGAYDDITDTITFHALGCTAADAYAAAAAVQALLHQAQRWWNSENISAMLLKIQTQDSALEILSTAVKGKAPGSGALVTLPPVWSETFGKYIIQGLTLQFVRRGRWLRTQESASSGAVTAPNVQTCTFASATAVFSPLSLEITGFNATNDMQQGASMLLWAAAAADFTFKEAEALNSGGDFTAVVEATARGGNILRLTPTGTGTQSTDQTISAGIPTTQQRIDVYAMIRNNNTARTYQIRACLFPLHSGNANDIVYGPWVPIDGSTTWARPIALGSFVSLSGWDVCFLEIIPSAIGGTLDIDYVFFQCRDNPLASGAVGVRVNSTPAYPGAYSFLIDDNGLSLPTPTVYQKASGQTNKYLSYAGSVAMNQIGSTAAVVWMSTSGTVFGQRNNAGAGFVSTTITARRRPALVVPQ